LSVLSPKRHWNASCPADAKRKSHATAAGQRGFFLKARTDKGSNSYPRQCSGSGGRRSASALRFGRSFCRQGRILLIQQDTDRRAVQILVLAGLQRPEEAAQPDKTEANRSRDQADEYTHCTGSGFIFIPLKPATARALAFLRRRKPLR